MKWFGLARTAALPLALGGLLTNGACLNDAVVGFGVPGSVDRADGAVTFRDAAVARDGSVHPVGDASTDVEVPDGFVPPSDAAPPPTDAAPPPPDAADSGSILDASFPPEDAIVVLARPNDGACDAASSQCPFDDGVLGPCNPDQYCPPVVLLVRTEIACDDLAPRMCWQRKEDGLCGMQCPEAPPCNDDAACPGETYCYRQPGLCGAEGRCAPIPLRCPDAAPPVCGCDGLSYQSACLAAQAGVNVASEGMCQDAGP